VELETLNAHAEARPCYLITDMGYDSDAFRDCLHPSCVRPVIPARSKRKTPLR
jgi:hypothetical protein